MELTKEANIYGEWFADQPSSTGCFYDPKKMVMNVAKMATAVATISFMGTGSAAIDKDSYESVRNGNNPYISLRDSAHYTENQNQADKVSFVRQVLLLSITDIAKAMNVSRQAVYNWMGGDSLSLDHSERLDDLVRAAEMIEQSGVVMKSTHIKRKIADGKNLVETAATGGSAQKAAQTMIGILQHEAKQRERLNKKFANRKTHTKSAESDFPAVNGMG